MSSSAGAMREPTDAEDTQEGDGVQEFRAIFGTMTEAEVRLWTRALLPSRAQRLLFDELTRVGTKAEVDSVAAQSLVRVRIFGQ